MFSRNITSSWGPQSPHTDLAAPRRIWLAAFHPRLPTTGATALRRARHQRDGDTPPGRLTHGGCFSVQACSQHLCEPSQYDEWQAHGKVAGTKFLAAQQGRILARLRGFRDGAPASATTQACQRGSQPPPRIRTSVERPCGAQAKAPTLVDAASRSPRCCFSHVPSCVPGIFLNRSYLSDVLGRDVQRLWKGLRHVQANVRILAWRQAQWRSPNRRPRKYLSPPA